MRKKIILILMFFVSIFSLVSCNEVKPNDNVTGQGNTAETKQSYSHTFKSGEFTKEGGKTANINGLIWDYDASVYLGYNADKGIQFGSKNNPQINPLIISCDFNEEVTITDYSIELSTASSGNSSYKVSFGSYNKEESFNNTTVKAFTVLNLNEKTNNFSLTLQAVEKAFYLKSISFSVIVNDGSKLNLKTDEIDIPSGSIKPGEGEVPKTNYKLVSVSEYYKDFNLTLTKEALRNELDLKNDLKTKVSYGDSRYMLQYTDESINKSGYVYGLYDGLDIEAKWQSGQTWNREHVWACNHMTFTGNRDLNNSTVDHKSDLHNLRACTNSVNSSRGDKYFSVLKTGVDYYNPNAVAPKGHDFRGDVARILLYMYVQYDFLLLNDNPNDNLDLSMGLLSELLKWHEEDKVDQFEMRRNNRIYEYQGNRNPFIDHPELAKQLF